MRRSTRMVVVVLFVVGALGTACVTNPVGPVTTAGGYREKASSTIEAVLGSVETARIVGEAEIEGKTFTSFTHQVVDDAFGPVRTAQDTFETVAPPDDEARQLQPKVLDALERSRRSLVAVATALDSTNLDAISRAVDQLRPCAEELRALHEQLQ